VHMAYDFDNGAGARRNMPVTGVKAKRVIIVIARRSRSNPGTLVAWIASSLCSSQ